jgi:hypothetical protein
VSSNPVHGEMYSVDTILYDKVCQWLATCRKFQQQPTRRLHRSTKYVGVSLMSGELSLRKHNNQKFNLFFPDNFFYLLTYTRSLAWKEIILNFTICRILKNDDLISVMYNYHPNTSYYCIKYIIVSTMSQILKKKKKFISKSYICIALRNSFVSLSNSYWYSNK